MILPIRCIHCLKDSFLGFYLKSDHNYFPATKGNVLINRLKNLTLELIFLERAIRNLLMGSSVVGWGRGLGLGRGRGRGLTGLGLGLVIGLGVGGGLGG